MALAVFFFIFSIICAKEWPNENSHPLMREVEAKGEKEQLHEIIYFRVPPQRPREVQTDMY